MFVFKKSKPIIFSHGEGAEFKFRMHSKNERFNFEVYLQSLQEKNPRIFTDGAINKDDYYAAWLLEDISGVQDENGTPHNIAAFDISDKADLLRRAKQTDPKFSPWFASHIEDTEKKIEEVAVDREMVGTKSLH